MEAGRKFTLSPKRRLAIITRHRVPLTVFKRRRIGIRRRVYCSSRNISSHVSNRLVSQNLDTDPLSKCQRSERLPQKIYTFIYDFSFNFYNSPNGSGVSFERKPVFRENNAFLHALLTLHNIDFMSKFYIINLS